MLLKVLMLIKVCKKSALFVTSGIFKTKGLGFNHLFVTNGIVY